MPQYRNREGADDDTVVAKPRMATRLDPNSARELAQHRLLLGVYPGLGQKGPWH